MYEKYVDLLKKKSIKITPQRLEILKYLDNNRNHPTAYQIYTDLKKNNPSLSKTTVYNYHHFMCKKCGRIIDIDIACPNIRKTLEQGHKIEEVHGYFKGKCRECIEKEINQYGS